jgi:hypothetical protein
MSLEDRIRGKPVCHPAPLMRVVMNGAIFCSRPGDTHCQRETYLLGKDTAVRPGIRIVIGSIVARPSVVSEKVRAGRDGTSVHLLECHIRTHSNVQAART